MDDRLTVSVSLMEELSSRTWLQWSWLARSDIPQLFKLTNSLQWRFAILLRLSSIGGTSSFNGPPIAPIAEPGIWVEKFDTIWYNYPASVIDYRASARVYLLHTLYENVFKCYTFECSCDTGVSNRHIDSVCGGHNLFHTSKQSTS